MEVSCCCGQVHDVGGLVAVFIRRLGPDVTVTTDDGSWRVPRAYIAAHGLLGVNVSTLALVYGWPEATDKDAATGAARTED